MCINLLQQLRQITKTSRPVKQFAGEISPGYLAFISKVSSRATTQEYFIYPIFKPKSPSGFHTFMPLQTAIDLPPTYLCLEENQSGTLQSGKFSSVSFSSAADTDLCTVLVLKTNSDGLADKPQVSATPTKSFTVYSPNSATAEVIMSPVSNQMTLQLAETKLTFRIINHLFPSVSVPSNQCQSFESLSNSSRQCDSGITSMLGQIYQQPSPANILTPRLASRALITLALQVTSSVS